MRRVASGVRPRGGQFRARFLGDPAEPADTALFPSDRLLARLRCGRDVGWFDRVTQRGQQCFRVTLSKFPLAFRSEMQVIRVAGKASRRYDIGIG